MAYASDFKHQSQTVYMLKGQSSVEYFLVVALGIVIASPFILSVQESLASVIIESEGAELENSLDSMSDAVAKADALGNASRTSFTLELPSRVQQAQLTGNGRALSYTVDGPGGVTNYTRIFDSNVSGELPVDEGSYAGYAESDGEKVELDFENFESE